MNLVIAANGKTTTTSKIIADHFGKSHRNVLRDIAGLECSDEFRQLNFELSSYTSPQNKVMPCIEMTRDGFCFLVMGFTGKAAGKWKEAFLKAFNELERVAECKSVMEALSEAIALMEADKQKASACGKALSMWKIIRREHIEQITSAHAKAQLVLNFAAEA